MFIVVYGCAGLLAGELGKKTTCDGTKAIRLLEPSEAILRYGKGWNLSGHIQAGKEVQFNKQADLLVGLVTLH